MIPGQEVFPQTPRLDVCWCFSLLQRSLNLRPAQTPEAGFLLLTDMAKCHPDAIQKDQESSKKQPVTVVV